MECVIHKKLSIFESKKTTCELMLFHLFIIINMLQLKKKIFNNVNSFSFINIIILSIDH